MSQLVTTPFFDCGCQPPSTTVPPTQNPNIYYDGTLGTPTAQGLVPANASLPAMAFEKVGAGQAYVWNPVNGTWN